MQRTWDSIATLATAALLCVAFGGAAAGQQGFGVRFGSLGGNSWRMFNLFGSQGSTRGIGAVSSSVTTLDGYNGYFAAGTIRPFVTGVIPVVGDQPRFTYSGAVGPAVASSGQSVLAERIARLESSGEVLGRPSVKIRAATNPDVSIDQGERGVVETLADDRSTAADAVDSIAAIRRQREAAKAEAFRVAADQFAQAARAEAEDKAALAIYHYKIARRDGDEATRRRSQERLDALVR
ncbi:MAG: hypothetical protein WD875_08630 [Pirellulales bacterium]